MEIQNIQAFIDYFEGVRKRTLNVVRAIPADKFDWTYREGKFTLADMVRHIAAIERYMFAENVQFKPSRYPGCGKELADGPENVLAFFDRMHQESVAIFGRLTPEDLQKKCVTPAGAPITVWKWLRLMVEHEIHHRGELYMYLNLLGVAAPPMYGMTSEQVREKSQ
ncbi:MAG: DinB family protein [Acidobacteriia bacterium]|nr:DinB family protein [Terriglobia bacterium]